MGNLLLLAVARKKKVDIQAVMKKIDNAFYSKDAEKAGDYFDLMMGTHGKISEIVKDLETIQGQPEFGKPSELGKIISLLKDMRKYGDIVNMKWDKLYLNHLNKVTLRKMLKV